MDLGPESTTREPLSSPHRLLSLQDKHDVLHGHHLPDNSYQERYERRSIGHRCIRIGKVDGAPPRGIRRQRFRFMPRNDGIPACHMKLAIS